MGIPLWLIYLGSGGKLYLTSPLTHLGGIAVSIYGIRKLGMPKNMWWKAIIAFLLLQVFCRLATPEEKNINLAFRVGDGWEQTFTSYWEYQAMIYGIGIALLFVMEKLVRKLVCRKDPSYDKPSAREI